MLRVLQIVAFLTFASIFVVEAQDMFSQMSEIFKNIDKNYDKDVRPPTENNGPTKIGVSIYVMALPKVDDINMEFHMDMYFRQFWRDTRLQYQSRQVRKIKQASLKHRVWTPDPFFVNQKEGHVLDNPADNTLFSIDTRGSIVYSSRQLVTTSCLMDLKKYPFDVQQCTLEIESFAHTVDEVVYNWKDQERNNNSVKFAQNITPPHFKLLGHTLGEVYITLSTGNYNRLKMTFFIQRNPGSFLHNAAIPAAIVVIVSSVSFWLHPVHDCGSRGLVILLSAFGLTATYLSAAANYLVLNYFTLADLFFFNCFGFLLLNTLVFLMMVVVGRNAKTREENGRCQNRCVKKLAWLDVVFRLAFIPLFLVYFVIFATSSGDETANIEGLVPYQ